MNITMELRIRDGEKVENMAVSMVWMHLVFEGEAGSRLFCFM